MLKFERFKVWQVLLPLIEGHGLPKAGRFDLVPLHIVVGRTTQGIDVIGEASRVDSADCVNETLRNLLATDINLCSPTTLWMRDSVESGAFAGMVRRKPVSSWESVKGSIFLMESLWVDAIGKAFAIPAHVLLGGRVRKKVKVDYWAAQPCAKELSRLVEIAVRLGCSGMKLKSDYSGNTVFAIKEIASDIPAGFDFTVDAMFNWRSLRESREIFSMMDNLDVAVRVEDPFPFEAIDDWQSVRQQYRRTLIWHTRSEDDLRVALRSDAADAFNIACRSVYEAMYLSQVLAFHSKDCWFGSQLESGIFQQLRLHAASAASTCVMPCDLQSQWVREHTLVAPGMAASGGYVDVCDEPGLGASIDHKALEKYSINQWTIE